MEQTPQTDTSTPSVSVNPLRFIRSQSYIPHQVANGSRVAVVGCGAVGRQVALMAAAMGIGCITLIDFDRCGPENASTQGWDLADDGQQKVEVLKADILRFNPACQVGIYAGKYEDTFIPPQAAVFACVDNMEIRRRIWEDMMDGRTMIDGRMSLHNSICIGAVKGVDDYMQHWFPDSEARQESCTAKGTLYGAAYTAAQMVNLLGKVLNGINHSYRCSYNFFGMEGTVVDVNYKEAELAEA